MKVVQGHITGGTAGRTGGITGSLPPELMEQAASRFAWIALISAASTVAFFGADAWLQREAYEAQRHPLLLSMAVTMLTLSLGFLLLHRTGRLSKQAVVYLGAGFQVFVSYAIALGEGAMLRSKDAPVIGVTAAALWTTLCGVVIPRTPIFSITVGILTIITWPLAYWTAYSVFGFEFIGWNRIGMWMMPLIMSVFWTTILNRRIYRLEIESHEARELGSYTLESLLGRGGMGEVWRARHRMLKRYAAVKLIRAEVLAGKTMRNEAVIRKRFEREARATAQLRSPHTVALFDFGLTGEGMFYYVMELLEGADIETIVEKHGPMHAGRVRNILVQVCESLEEAHRLGMVHRDVKPRNIFLSKLGWQHDFAKVLDFGLVKTTRDPEAEDSVVTRDGMTTGTPAYMAPEMAMGEEVDGRADIYGLGCVAYYMLTGELVFQENSATAMALAHVQKQPVRPSERTELPIPPGLEAVIMSCLEKNPAQRPASPQELARKLESLRDVPHFCRDMAATWWEVNLPDLTKPKANATSAN